MQIALKNMYSLKKLLLNITEDDNYKLNRHVVRSTGASRYGHVFSIKVGNAFSFVLNAIQTADGTIVKTRPRDPAV